MYFITAVIIPVVIIVIAGNSYRKAKNSYDANLLARVVAKVSLVISFMFLVFHIIMLFMGMEWWWLLVSYLLYNIPPGMHVDRKRREYDSKEALLQLEVVENWERKSEQAVAVVYILLAPIFWFNSIKDCRIQSN